MTASAGRIARRSSRSAHGGANVRGSIVNDMRERTKQQFYQCCGTHWTIIPAGIGTALAYCAWQDRDGLTIQVGTIAEDDGGFTFHLNRSDASVDELVAMVIEAVKSSECAGLADDGGRG